MSVELKRKPQGKSGRRGGKTGEAVCDMKGDLWEIDGVFLILMKQAIPGWSGGNIPQDVISELKNTGRYQAEGMLLTAQPTSGGQISLVVKPAD
ncbi:hypothetical protein [Amphritea japonica]|uniref:hypothetical protein n=1 Tax=Amphritea japonica TaxID=452627 RepID=UPI0003787517|nr:hypothetical protein [Amphritea japonica]